MRLKGPNAPAIGGVVVDNGNSTVDVWCYQGPSAIGNPIIIPAGWARGFSLNGSESVYFVFRGVPSASGQTFISVTEENIIAFSSQEATVTIAGTVPVDITAAVPIQVQNSAVPLIVNLNNPPTSPFPVNAVPFSTPGGTVDFLNASVFTFAIATALGQRAWITDLGITGLDDDSFGYEWTLYEPGGGTGTSICMKGDFNRGFTVPWVTPAATAIGGFRMELTISGSTIGTPTAFLYAIGYVL